jgi:hypothetical protein
MGNGPAAQFDCRALYQRLFFIISGLSRTIGYKHMKNLAASGKRQAASGKRNQGECPGKAVTRFLQLCLTSPLLKPNTAPLSRTSFACGLWLVACGLWLAACGLRLAAQRSALSYTGLSMSIN